MKKISEINFCLCVIPRTEKDAAGCWVDEGNATRETVELKLSLQKVPECKNQWAWLHYVLRMGGTAWMISKFISQHFFHELGCMKSSKGRTTACICFGIYREGALSVYRCELSNFKNQTKLQARLESSIISANGKRKSQRWIYQAKNYAEGKMVKTFTFVKGVIVLNTGKETGKTLAEARKGEMILYVEVRVWAAFTVPIKNHQNTGFTYKIGRRNRVFQTALVQSLTTT